MAYRIVPPNEWPPEGFVPDEGNNGYVYNPMDPPREEDELAYSLEIQNSNNSQANLVAVADQWIRSWFPPMYWKWSCIRTQVPFSQFKSDMLSIYKKDRPIIVMDPHQLDVDDVMGSPLNTNMITRFNEFDPEYQPIGTKIAYSLPLMKSDRFEIVYRRARMRMDIDVLMIVDTLNQQSNLYNHLIMNIRHRSQFTLVRQVPVLIPQKHIINAAKFHGYDWKSDEFLSFLNSISKYPIRKEIRTNGKYMFFMLQELHIYVEVPNYPAKDNPEMSDQIEWGARITDTFSFTADLPLEFIFLTKKENRCNFDPGIEEDTDAISFISPIYNDLDWPTEHGEFKLAKKFDVELQAGEDPTLSILPLLADFDKAIYEECVRWVGSGQPIREILQIHVYPNGSYREIGSELRSDGILELIQARENQLYTVLVYVNIKTLNLVREGRNIQYIGTIQKPNIQGL